MSFLFLSAGSESGSEESYYSIEDNLMLQEINYIQFSYANLLARAHLLSERVKQMLEEISGIQNRYHLEDRFENDVLRDDKEDQVSQEYNDSMDKILEHYSYILGT